MENNITSTKQSRSIPQLRFPEFEEEWRKDKIGTLCNFIVPGRNKPKKFDGGIPWITTPDIDNSAYIIKSKSGLAVSVEDAKYAGAKIVPENSIIMSCVGDLGILAMTKNPLIINQQLHAFLPKKGADNWFLLYALSTKTKFIERVATKTAVPYLNKDNCNSIPIDYPSLPEQTRIATFLSAVDKRINLLQKKKAQLEQYKKGAMQKLFTVKADGNPSLRFKDGNGNDYPDWEEKKLGEIALIATGSTPSTSNKEFYGGEKLFVSPSDINTNRYINETITTLTDVGFKKGRKIAKGSSLFVCIGSTIGKVGQVKYDCITNQQINSLTATDKNSDNFIYYLLQYQAKKIKRLAGVQAVPQINKTDFSRLKYFSPSLPEQKKIATFLSSIDKQIENVGKQIASSQQWKKGLLQKMFV